MGKNFGLKKILFRADAKPSIGIGDLVSLLHLSKYFERDSWETHFIIRSYKAGMELVKKHNIKNLFIIDGEISVQQEVKNINEYIKKHKIDVIFFEITERKLNEYNGLTKDILKAGACFDNTILDNIDLVVNWDTGRNSIFDEAKYPNTRFLLGPEYAILPIDFDYNKVRARMYKASPESLLIAMGGADEFNLTQRIVEILARNKCSLRLNIVIGSGYEHKEKLKRTLSSSGLRYDIKENLTNMFDEYMQCDIAVGAGGLTSYELIATRTPAVLIATYEHQIARCIYFNEKGYARYLGFREVSDNALIKNIYKPFPEVKSITFNTNKIIEAINELLQRY